MREVDPLKKQKPSEADFTAVSSDSLVVFAAVPNGLSPLKAHDAKLAKSLAALRINATQHNSRAPNITCLNRFLVSSLLASSLYTLNTT